MQPKPSQGIIPSRCGPSATLSLSTEPILGSLVKRDVSYRTVALVISCALFMESLNATVLATALPSMARDLGVLPSEMGVALSAYLMALAIFIPASGALADRFGAKTTFQCAIAIFVLTSVLCGLTNSLAALMLARLGQGIGGAMIISVGRLIMLRSVAKHHMLTAMAWMMVPAMMGPIIGPPFGGLIVDWFNWRWIFWLNVPIGLLGLILAKRFFINWRSPSPPPLDVKGFALSATALACFLGGFELIGRQGAAVNATLMVIAGLGLSALYLLHAKVTENAILDLSLVRIPTFRLSMIGGSLTRITQGAQPFLLPMMLQLGFGMSPAQSGFLTIATALGALGMKGLAQTILRRFGFRSSLIFIGILAAGGFAVCGFFRPGWPLSMIFTVLVVSGFAMSFQFTAYNTIAFDDVEPARLSSATSFYSTFQQFTLATGVCVGGIALHVSMALNDRKIVSLGDFSAAWWTVTAISLLAVFANARFDRQAGEKLIVK